MPSVALFLCAVSHPSSPESYIICEFPHISQMNYYLMSYKEMIYVVCNQRSHIHTYVPTVWVTTASQSVYIIYKEE